VTKASSFIDTISIMAVLLLEPLALAGWGRANKSEREFGLNPVLK
jgi:hypothetical protein